MKNQQLVSVITPCYNAEDYLYESISSVLAQSYRNLELIVVDDCSSDGSLELLMSLSKCDTRMKVLKLKSNSGPAVARNVAINAAQGRYIAFLDSDDIWKKNKLEKQIKFMQENNYPFTYTSYSRFSTDLKGKEYVGAPDKLTYSDLLKTCYIGCLTSVYDSKYFGKIKMPLISKRQDWALWLKLLKKVEFAYGLNEELSLYRVRSDSISSNKLSAAKYVWLLYRRVEKLGLFESVYYFVNYALRGFARTKMPRLARLTGILNQKI